MGLIVKEEIATPSDKSKRFSMRMDSKLYEQIAAVAALHRRSVSSEIECAIAAYLEELSDSNNELKKS